MVVARAKEVQKHVPCRLLQYVALEEHVAGDNNIIEPWFCGPCT